MVYTTDFDIFYKDSANKSGTIRLDVLLLLLQEAAILHSEAVGFTEEYMERTKSAWFLNKLSLSMEELPKRRERITVKTWSKEFFSFKAIREFELYRKDMLIGKASSQWFFIDSEQKRLKRIPEEVKSFYGEYPQSVDLDLSFLDKREPSFKVDCSKTFTLRHCDIDSNGHLNNTVYAQFVIDVIKQLSPSFRYKRFHILYKKEVTYNRENINCAVGEIADGTYCFKIFKDDTIFAYGELFGEKIS